MTGAELRAKFPNALIVYVVYCRQTIWDHFVHAIFLNEDDAKRHVARTTTRYFKWWSWWKTPDIKIEARIVNQ
jgi:hypothetical protein